MCERVQDANKQGTALTLLLYLLRNVAGAPRIELQSSGASSSVEKDLCFCFSPGLVHCCVLGRGHPNVRVNIFPPKQKPPPSSTLTITDTHTRPPKGGLNTAQGDLLLPVATMGTFTSTAGRAAGRAAFAFA